ncbi:DMT family transporter [Confluentibacter flavum]|uniref:EamA family transporter n=1 Tax=Confluentibacter flavum TaxID=1909700 RepID=A0A2N3HHR2_9FLAO|nr:DMT family transporter [Confluentibacter flavum]PKQ44422.1 EamA family transporter [Confluentibacter flavum]
MIKKKKPWLLFAIITTIFWGIWGAFIGLPVENGFPNTLIYCIWSLTMIPPSIFILEMNGWKLQTDKKSILYGLTIGILGAGGQMLLFYAVTIGPTYLIFPVISISPIVTILLSFIFLKERTGVIGTIGIGLALLSLPLFEYTNEEAVADDNQVLWFILALIVLVAWGVQAFYMKLANKTMNTESIFFYMTLSGLLLTPIALFLTDFSKEINYGLNGPYLTAGIQILNSVGCVFLVYAYRYGKAMVVSPVINAGAPLMTAIISMVMLGILPNEYKIFAIILAILASILLALDPEE